MHNHLSKEAKWDSLKGGVEQYLIIPIQMKKKKSLSKRQNSRDIRGISEKKVAGRILKYDS